jgi:hypothetical protein
MPDLRQMTAETRNKDVYDFYRCRRCGKLLTLVQERMGLRNGQLCKCGSKSYSPTMPNGILEWLSPHVIVFWILRKLKRPIAHNPEFEMQVLQEQAIKEDQKRSEKSTVLEDLIDGAL